MMRQDVLDVGCEQYERWAPVYGDALGVPDTAVRYEYRDWSGDLFACVADTLDKARAMRDRELSA